jgi:hypothetical protein
MRSLDLFATVQASRYLQCSGTVVPASTISAQTRGTPVPASNPDLTLTNNAAAPQWQLNGKHTEGNLWH